MSDKPFRQVTPASTSEMIALLTQHQAALYAFLRALLPSAADAEDVLQETNIAIWESIARFESGTNFRAFAMKVAYHRAIDHGRTRKRSSILVFNSELIERISGTLIDDAASLESVRESDLERCLAGLSTDDRKLIRLRYYQQRTIRDLVSVTGKSETNLQYHFGRIRGLLRACIESTQAAKSI